MRHLPDVDDVHGKMLGWRVGLGQGCLDLNNAYVRKAHSSPRAISQPFVHQVEEDRHELIFQKPDMLHDIFVRHMLQFVAPRPFVKVLEHAKATEPLFSYYVHKPTPSLIVQA